MDDQSLTTILDLLRADAQEFSQTNPNAQNDLDPVVRAWQEEGDRYVSQSVDYRVAMSLARVIQQDRQTLGAFSDEESHAATDRLLAIRLAQEEVNQQPEQAQGGQPDQPRVRPQPPTQQPQATCVACTETLLQTDVTTAPCSHIYCRDCTIKLFEDSLRDETLFPPRCCRTAIPLPLVQHFLSPDIRREFENKTVEYNDGNRTYCSSPICSRYLHPFPNPRVNGRYCARCNLWTCMRCKKSHYPGNACPDENEGMLQLAKKSGWRRCSRCKNMVELRTGCNHITCRCHREFCYVCGAIWKTCTCELWDERRLVEAGDQQEIHGCDHDAWRRRKGDYNCEECDNQLRWFIYECESCGFRACVTCRYNRL